MCTKIEITKSFDIFEKNSRKKEIKKIILKKPF